MNTELYLYYLYRSTFLPIHYYKSDTCLIALPESEKSCDLTQIFTQQLLGNQKEVDYIVTNSFLYYGIVRNFKTNAYIIIGPVTSIQISETLLSQILMESAISLKHKEKIRYFFETSPCFSYYQFLHFLAMLHMFLNHKTIDPIKYFQDLRPQSLTHIDRQYSSVAYEAKEDYSMQHNTYDYESELFRCIESGNVEALNTLTQRPYLKIGQIANTSLRQEKNILIAAVTLYTRHAIAGGLDIETAYRLSDTYIMEAEKSISIEEVTQLLYSAIFDFTNRVRAVKIPKDISPDVYQCIQYISAHTNTPITTDDVARAVGKSRTYISKKFKQEMNFNLSDFIRRKKLEEAKSLLTYSDKSLTEISNYLCFSSQSYFQNVFKKQYGITPMQHRKKGQKL